MLRTIKNKILFAAAVAAIAIPAQVAGQCDAPWTSNTIRNCNGYDYELWGEDQNGDRNIGNVSMTITGDNGEGEDAVGGAFTATWSNTINILFRSGRKWTDSQGNRVCRDPAGAQIDCASPGLGDSHTEIGEMTLEYDATWTSGDGSKMLGVYGWAFYAPESVPTACEERTNMEAPSLPCANGQTVRVDNVDHTVNFSNQIEFYIIQQRGDFNPGARGVNARKYGEAEIDGVLYEFWAADRIRKWALTGQGDVDFKQYFSVPANNVGVVGNTAQTKAGVISVSEHFRAWERVGMLMDGPLYEVAMKVESYTGASRTGNGSATVRKSLLRIGDVVPEGHSLRVASQPNGSGTVTRSPLKNWYDDGDIVTLTATPANEYWEFDRWEGDATGSTNTATVTMNGDKVVQAIFKFVAEGVNLIRDGTFTQPIGTSGSTTTDWTLNRWGDDNSGDDPTFATFTQGDNGSITINVLTVRPEAHNIQLVQEGVPLLAGMTYEVSFDIFSDVEREVEVMCQLPVRPWTGYFNRTLTVTPPSLIPGANNVRFQFTMEDNDPNARFGFNIGQALGSVTIGNVSVVALAGGDDDCPPGQVLGDDGECAAPGSVRHASRNRGVRDMRVTARRNNVNVRFRAPQTGTSELRLYSVNGRLVSRSTIQTVEGRNYNHRMTTGRLPSGVYVVAVVGANGGREVMRERVVVR